MDRDTIINGLRMMIIIPEDALRIAEALSAPIEELGLSVRSYNGLRRWGITTVADVYRAYQNKQLPRIRNLGEKSVIEIEKHLEEHLAKVAHVNTSETPNSSDTISRQQAIDTLRGYLVGKRCPDDGTLTCRLIENEVINKLPPAQLSTNLAEVGTDCISRRAAIDRLTEYGNGRAVFISVGEAVIRIEQLPPIQPDNGLQKLADEIASFKRCVKSENSDYLTGYLCALSVVEGMIADMREVTE